MPTIVQQLPDNYQTTPPPQLIMIATMLVDQGLVVLVGPTGQTPYIFLPLQLHLFLSPLSHTTIHGHGGRGQNGHGHESQSPGPLLGPTCQVHLV